MLFVTCKVLIRQHICLFAQIGFLWRERLDFDIRPWDVSIEGMSSGHINDIAGIITISLMLCFLCNLKRKSADKRAAVISDRSDLQRELCIGRHLK